MVIARLAWLMLTCRIKAHEDWNRASELAQKACEIAQSKDGFFFNVWAAALSKLGKFEQAVESQEQALATPTDEIDHERSAYEQRLGLYRAKKPFPGLD